MSGCQRFGAPQNVLCDSALREFPCTLRVLKIYLLSHVSVRQLAAAQLYYVLPGDNRLGMAVQMVRVSTPSPHGISRRPTYAITAPALAVGVAGGTGETVFGDRRALSTGVLIAR